MCYFIVPFPLRMMKWRSTLLIPFVHIRFFLQKFFYHFYVICYYGFVKYGNIGVENSLPNVWQVCASALRNQPPLTRLTRWYLNWTNYWYKPSRIALGRPRLIASSEKRIVFDYPNYAILDLEKQDELLILKHGKRKIETHLFSAEFRQWL